MKVIKKINTSAAIALDSAGNEVVILGKGVGFPSVPYDLTDLSVIERTFYDVDSKSFSIIKTLPEKIIAASAEIAEIAEIELDAELNPNLTFTLADHLNFAVERLKRGMDLTGAVSYDISHLYPKETALGHKGLRILKEVANIVLPASEAINIAMHLLNAELKVNDISIVMKNAKILTEIEKLIETRLNYELDKQSYEYSRFISHIRYLTQRLSTKEQTNIKNEGMLTTLAQEYPDIYECTLAIVDYLDGTWGWKCNDDEILYLMLHINRVKTKER